MSPWRVRLRQIGLNQLRREMPILEKIQVRRLHSAAVTPAAGPANACARCLRRRIVAARAWTSTLCKLHSSALILSS